MVGDRCESVLEITISIQFRVSNHSHPRRKQFFINRDRNRPRPVQSVASLAIRRSDRVERPEPPVSQPRINNIPNDRVSSIPLPLTSCQMGRSDGPKVMDPQHLKIASSCHG